MKEITCMNKPIDMKEFVVEAKLENLNAVQEFIIGELEAADCSMKLQTQLALVAEEIFVNIVYYAYSQDEWPGGPQNERSAMETGDVAIRVVVGDEVIIEFEDSGKPFNPLEKEDPDIALDAEIRKIGGLGIFMVKNMTDNIKYRYEDNKNILMIKKIVA